MSDKQSESSSQLSDFVNYYNLTNNFGLTRFNASVKFDVKGKITWLDADIKIDRDGYNNYGRLTILSDVPLLFPASFSANFDEIYFDREVGLKITGNYTKSGLGHYTAYIIVN